VVHDALIQPKISAKEDSLNYPPALDAKLSYLAAHVSRGTMGRRPGEKRRPLRVRSASVNDDLLTALGLQPAMGRLFRKGEADLVGPPPAPGSPPVPLPPFVILSHELWQTAFGGQNIVGQTVEVAGLPREVIGILPPGTDVMDNRTEIWLPLGLNPGNRQNRGSHFLLIGRLKDGVTPRQAQTELTALIQNWGERVGVKRLVFSPLPRNDADRKANPGAGHILQMTGMQE